MSDLRARTAICRRCNSEADVLVMKDRSITAPAFAYCDDHDPDPEAYGNKSTWEDKLVLRRYDSPRSEYNVYGRPGASEKYDGRVMHIETPDSSGILCSSRGVDRRRFKLSHTFPDEYSPCGSCVGARKWESEFNRSLVGTFIQSVRKVLEESGKLPDRATRYIEYQTPSPRCNHAFSEGVQRGIDCLAQADGDAQ